MTVSKAPPPTSKNAIVLAAINVPDGMSLVPAVGLAIVAQILIINQWTLPGILAYLTCAILLFARNYRNTNRNFDFTNQLHLNPRGEYILVGILLLLTIGARFFDLDTRVYGLEGDETRWTVQSWYSTILLRNIGEFASLHYDYLPVDFWVRSIFLRVFGLDFISARIESAVLSLLSVIFLYLLVRLLTSSAPTGLLSALLFSFSFVELSAAHQALHNTIPAVWTLASFAVLFAAFRHRKLWQFQAAGILLTLGMLTYETFYPNCILALVYLFGMAIHEIRNKRSSVLDWVAPLVLTAWPMAAIYTIFARDYINERQYYLLGQLQSSISVGDGMFLGGLQFIWGNFQNVLRVTFWRIIWADSLVNWDGPLINPFLLPFIVIGFIHNLWNIRKPHFIFIPLWYVFHTVSGPILLGSAWPRVMYLATPPLMIWGALGLWITLATLRVIFTNLQSRMVGIVFLLILATIIGNDYYIFSNRLIDSEQSRKRRELADLTASTARDNISSMLLFPYLTDHHDEVALEGHILTYSIAGARNLGLDAADHFEQINMSLLLPELWRLKDKAGLDIVFDKTASEFKGERQKFLQIILDCYPQANITHKGQFFDSYHFDRQALQSPQCFSPQPPLNVTPEDGLPLAGSSQPIFQWDTNGTATTGFDFTIQQKRESTFWIEAEEEFSGEGWTSENGFVREFSGAGFILDAWQAREAKYSFENQHANGYRVWVRYYKRINDDQRNLIRVDQHVSEFAGDGVPVNEWVWEPVGTYELPAGSIPIAFTRTYGANGHYSVFIDAIVITSDMDFQPNQEEGIWQDIFSTGEINSSASHYSLVESLSPGEYWWKVRIFDGDKLIDSTGARGIESTATRFITP